MMYSIELKYLFITTNRVMADMNHSNMGKMYCRWWMFGSDYELVGLSLWIGTAADFGNGMMRHLRNCIFWIMGICTIGTVNTWRIDSLGSCNSEQNMPGMQ